MTGWSTENVTLIAVTYGGGRSGLAMRAFALDWQECQAMLAQLGYVVRLEVTPV